MVTGTFQFVDFNTLTWMDLTLDRNSPRHVPIGQALPVSFVNKSAGGSYLYTLRREVRKWQDGELYWHWEISYRDDIDIGVGEVLVEGTEMYCRAKIVNELTIRGQQKPVVKPIAEQPEDYGQW